MDRNKADAAAQRLYDATALPLADATVDVVVNVALRAPR